MVSARYNNVQSEMELIRTCCPSGVAIVASSFSLPSTSSSASPKFSSFSPSTFQEDPFASTSTSPSQFSSDADISLGLMMMRNASLKILGEIKVARADEGAPSHAQSSKSATKKGTASIARKGKGKNVDASPNGLVKVETPQDVRVYIDDRCPATCSWFQDMFCREGRQDCGVRLEMGGECAAALKCRTTALTVIVLDR